VESIVRTSFVAPSAMQGIGSASRTKEQDVAGHRRAGDVGPSGFVSSKSGRREAGSSGEVPNASFAR